ncbi:hypothetical protein EYC80_007122 [Monilinia laxa]|uniref:Uncharacterized protein n=1 Tax=Monilinia laxa TaxID=61186 RepID=A0A5N6K0M2_MONLA|nr:hypothetical protein EYC80_007122 [Monilinia laxa]
MRIFTLHTHAERDSRIKALSSIHPSIHLYHSTSMNPHLRRIIQQPSSMRSPHVSIERRILCGRILGESFVVFTWV